MKRLVCLLSIFAIANALSIDSLAQEHPGEHPGVKTEAEHPGAPAEHKEHPPKPAEHPGKTPAEEHPGEKEMLSRERIIQGIKEHIDSVTNANNGIFPIFDPKMGEDLRLKLVKVHEDKVSYIKKEDAYFACTDFATKDGKATYDVDFWMKESDGKLVVYKTMIHKKDGTPRFTYQDDEIVELKH